MKSFILVLAVISIICISSFALMVGFTGGAISVGTELSPSTFIYAGISYPLGIMAGGGMKIGDLYNLDFGKSSTGQEIGSIKIGYGAVADVEVYSFLGVYGSVFAGPALILNAYFPTVNVKTLSYTAIGFSWPSYSLLTMSGGIFYVF
ncbi:hypothetical protein [Athalassotoga saccharophila]|uniref:hypothetical protein n=1 Tax=Athalassotoga saccharophila TaxID=1441386 RepID=UPI001379B77E|nr:hypothetical protein [Athalassotoga saccharophila]BBJ28647.1 hypothetical protein ATHSA_1566 [Athalassotoga saccharophila]